MPTKNPNADRLGGPGASHEDAAQGERESRPKVGPKTGPDIDPKPGEPTNPDRSRVSGGGGERDRHHTHTDKRS